MILPERQARRSAGMEDVPFPVRQFLTFPAGPPRKNALGRSDINSFVISFYPKLFTLSTEFSTGRKAFAFNVFRQRMEVFHPALAPFSPVFPPVFPLHNPYLPASSPFFRRISSGQRGFCTASAKPFQKSKSRPFTWQAGGMEVPSFPFIFPHLTSVAQEEKRPEGRFSTFIFGFPQERIRGPGPPGSGWRRR